MTVAKPYLISNVRSGLERDVAPWLLPQDAFPDLQDCFMFRGRIERRKGYDFLGRLVTFVGLATGLTFVGTSPITPLFPFQVYITVEIAGANIIFFDDGAGNLISNVGVGTFGTVNYGTGAITLTFAVAIVGNANVAIADNLPVMGLKTRDLDTPNVNQLIAFDTTNANIFSNTAQLFEDITFYKTSGTAFTWTGSNSQFFWTTNYLGSMWATNGNFGFQSNPTATTPASGDGIRWYDGTGWVNFLPWVNNAHNVFLMGAQIIVSYRNRLVCLNTVEGTSFATPINFFQRARWSQNGTPYGTVAPVNQGSDTNAWNSDTVGKGGFIDAPTGEEIISAEFYKDTLIVFFEESTWQLRYTGNETLPFVWERINVDFGAESTFSTIAFDAGIVSVGNYGIISCDATGVKRIDQVIPDEVFDFHNGNNGPERVYGIRDYPRQLVYWTFPNADVTSTFPNRVLVYNYLDGSYSFFNDSITCFGTYQSFNDQTWLLSTAPWQGYPNKWDSGVLQADYPQIVAGNQQGFVLNNYNAPGDVANQKSLAISGATQTQPCLITALNDNLPEGTIIQINNVNGMTQLNGNIYRVSTAINANQFAIEKLDVNGNWMNLDATGFTAYTGSGFITVKNNMIVLTKVFNPFIEQGEQVRLQWVDLYLEASPILEFTMNVYLDENDNTPVQFEFVAPTSPSLAKVWERAYVSAIGQFCQLEFTFDPEQITDPSISDGDLVIHAMMLWMSSAGRLTYGTIM